MSTHAIPDISQPPSQPGLNNLDSHADTSDMTPKKSTKTVCRCAYTRVCYLAEELRCFGYRTDCVLYLKSNGEAYPEYRFHEAMDTLINKTRAKYEKLPK